MSSDTIAAVDDWAEQFAGQILDGRYEIETLLGEGGMGAVFRGKQIQLRKPVAIKLLRPEFGTRKVYRERFLREARAASRIGHPNVVDISDFGETSEGRVFFVMELLEGEDLARLLRREGALPWRRTKEILLQMVRALKAAHAKSVIHRDVKPANVFLVRAPDEDGDRVKVLDFGVAKVTDPASSAAEGLTSADKVMGTAMYMAPEQALGKLADARSDVYAVGCVAYQMLAGRPAFAGTNALEILMRRLNEPPPSLAEELPHIGDAIEIFVRRAMARDPGDRFQSMKDMEDALREIPETLDVGVPITSASAAIDHDLPTSTSARRKATDGSVDGTWRPSSVPTEAASRPSEKIAAEHVPSTAAPLASSTTPALEPATPRTRGRVWLAAPVLAAAVAGSIWLAFARRDTPPPRDGAVAADEAVRGSTPDEPVRDEPARVDVATPAANPTAPVAEHEPDPAQPEPIDPTREPPPPPDSADIDVPTPSKREPRAKRPKAAPVRDVDRTLARLRKLARRRCEAAIGTRVTIDFNIEASGKAAMINVAAGTDPTLASCLRGLVRAASFGPGELQAGSLVVTW